MSSIKEHEGSIIINKPTIFAKSELCAVVGKGIFPPYGDYEKMTFTPRPGTTGILAFVGETRTSSYITYFQYWWNQEKVICKEGILKHIEPLSLSKTGGLVLTVRSRHYCTEDEHASTKGALLVDLKAVLQFINGDITLKELHKNAGSVARRQKRQDTLKQVQNDLKTAQEQVHELAEENADLRASNDFKCTEISGLLKKNERIEKLYSDLVAEFCAFEKSVHEAQLAVLLEMSKVFKKVEGFWWRLCHIGQLKVEHEKLAVFVDTKLRAS